MKTSVFDKLCYKNHRKRNKPSFKASLTLRTTGLEFAMRRNKAQCRHQIWTNIEKFIRQSSYQYMQAPNSTLIEV